MSADSSNSTSLGVCFKKIVPHQSCRILLDTMPKFALFSVSGLNDKKLIKKQTYTKIILQYFEYFCQMSSKSINVILSYTVSKFVHFFEIT